LLPAPAIKLCRGGPSRCEHEVFLSYVGFSLDCLIFFCFVCVSAFLFVSPADRARHLSVCLRRLSPAAATSPSRFAQPRLCRVRRRSLQRARAVLAADEQSPTCWPLRCLSSGRVRSYNGCSVVLPRCRGVHFPAAAQLSRTDLPRVALPYHAAGQSLLSPAAA